MQTTTDLRECKPFLVAAEQLLKKEFATIAVVRLSGKALANGLFSIQVDPVALKPF